MKSLQVGVPCPKKWDELTGGEEKRFCDQCQTHVHNLSVAGAQETERLAREVEAGGRVCVAYFTTETGAIRYQTPSPTSRVRRWMMGVQSFLAFCLPFAMVGTSAAEPPKKDGEHRQARLGSDGEIVMGKIAPPPRPTPTPTPPMIRGEAVAGPGQGMIMGDVCVVPTPTPTPIPKN